MIIITNSIIKLYDNYYRLYDNYFQGYPYALLVRYKPQKEK